MNVSANEPRHRESKRPQFRSILPHEPWDFDKYDDKGYMHLQGAFEPKAPKKRVDEKSVSLSPSYYWTTKESLQEALLKALRVNHRKHRLSFPVESLECLDSLPPFTKVRLQFATPHQAVRLHFAWKTIGISPHDLLSVGNDVAPLTFSTHSCQATMVTSKPLNRTDSSFYWPRSSPPRFRGLLHDHNDEMERSQTRFIYVTGLCAVGVVAEEQQNVWDDIKIWSSDSYAILYALRNVFGQDVEIFLPSNQLKQQRYCSFGITSCHVGFSSPEKARHAVESLQGKSVRWEHPSVQRNRAHISGPLFLDYVTIAQKSKAIQQARASGTEAEKGDTSRAECTSTTDAVTVPGLHVIEDYLTKDQEQALMAVLTGPQAPWAPQQSNRSQTGAVKRKVQHYGYVFDYETADVLRDRSVMDVGNYANCPPLPSIAVEGSAEDVDSGCDDIMDRLVQEGKGWDVLAHVIEKTRRHQFKVGDKLLTFPDINQLTVNQYKPGEGIGSHVDTPSAFGDGLISISLNSGIVMEFRKVQNRGSADTKKLVYLPPRSLVLMSGHARYEWEHQIVTRRTDTHQGEVLSRGLRVSLTLRTALNLNGSPMPVLKTSSFPPKWKTPNCQQNRNALATPQTERDHVHAVYDAIATQWHHTRGKRGVLWPGATQFLRNLPVGSVVADIGCGDGKYFPAIWEAGSFVIGTDISRPLLVTSFQRDFGEQIAHSRKVSKHRESLQARPAVAVGDCMSVPLRENSVDAAICIAVMHHLSTLGRRVRCIEELARIVKPGGRINVQAWALEQEDDSRRRFAASDVFVPFNAQPKYSNADYDERKGLVVFQRYCHLYRAGEMEGIVDMVKGVRLVESGYESGNHFVILETI